jgi:hypothetical protein
MSAKRAVARMRAPDELGSEERAWMVVRSAYQHRTAPLARRSRWRLILVPVLAALITGVALSPAGATIGRAIKQALGVQHAAPALVSLPTRGTLLVSGRGGTWTIAADGSARHLGDWPQASLSPHGLYIAVARNDQLAAIDPQGVSRWTLARPAVADPRWYSPNGFRLLYLSGHQLRIVAGDGTGDHLLATRVAPVAPAWRPDHPYQVAYVDGQGRLVVRDGDTGRLIWQVPAEAARTLDWSANGSRLLVLTRTSARIYGQTGRMIAGLTTPAGAPLVAGSLSPDGDRLGLVRAGATQDVVVASVNRHSLSRRRVLTGAGIAQVAWSPDGTWLLATWPAADQWVFIRVSGTPRIVAVSRIAQQYGEGSPAGGFPRLDGWCCTAAAHSG